MKKQQMIDIVNNLHSYETLSFVEIMDTGEPNIRLMSCSKDEILTILNTFFDDDLYGHVRDYNMTTIKSYIIT
jgi:hypothetical protein